MARWPSIVPGDSTTLPFGQTELLKITERED